MTSTPEGQSKLLSLKLQGESLDESRKPEVQQLVKAIEQQWKTLLQAARQMEHRSLSDDFDDQSKNTQSWIRDKQLKLQSLGSYTPPEGRSQTAQVCMKLLSCTMQYVLKTWL